MFTLRLMACMGAAGVVSEVLPLQRSYWVPLTVAIVFKPDYGSVFARALQRGIGTVVGAVAGAVLLVPRTASTAAPARTTTRIGRNRSRINQSGTHTCG